MGVSEAVGVSLVSMATCVAKTVLLWFQGVVPKYLGVGVSVAVSLVSMATGCLINLNS